MHTVTWQYCKDSDLRDLEETLEV